MVARDVRLWLVRMTTLNAQLDSEVADRLFKVRDILGGVHDLVHAIIDGVL